MTSSCTGIDTVVVAHIEQKMTAREKNKIEYLQLVYVPTPPTVRQFSNCQAEGFLACQEFCAKFATNRLKKDPEVALHYLLPPLSRQRA